MAIPSIAMTLLLTGCVQKDNDHDEASKNKQEQKRKIIRKRNQKIKLLITSLIIVMKFILKITKIVILKVLKRILLVTKRHKLKQINVCKKKVVLNIME